MIHSKALSFIKDKLNVWASDICYVSLMDRQDGMKEDKKSRIGVLFL
jgi:hypothetical protein